MRTVLPDSFFAHFLVGKWRVIFRLRTFTGSGRSEAMMYYDVKESGQRIKKLRKERKLTQEQLAERLGISVKTVTAIETGARGTSIDGLVTIAEFFGVSLDYLVLGKKSEVIGIEIPEEKKEFALKMLKVILENIPY